MEQIPAIPTPLLVQAEQRLVEYVRRAGLEMNVLANYDTQKHLAELAGALLERLRASERYPNRPFRGLAEALARCIVLYEQRPDEYARLVQGVSVCAEDLFLDSFEGLCTLETVLRGLSDDHDYVFNPLTSSIEVQNAATGHLSLLAPAKLLEILVQRTPSLQLEAALDH